MSSLPIKRVTFNHLADTFNQNDLQIKTAIEAVKLTIGQNVYIFL